MPTHHHPLRPSPGFSLCHLLSGLSNTCADGRCSYIHGGAWRDPRILHDGFVPSIRSLISSDQAPHGAIRGFISIDYRLSPHDQFPQDSATTPAAELRRASHPDHIQDVRSALAFAHAQYQISGDYVLLGHSAGATLSYQLLMGEDALGGRQAVDVPLPAAIIGISGIYDLVSLSKRFEGQYDGFISNAFGTDAATWGKASPARYPQSFKDKWTNRQYNIIAWSPEDSLVDEPEIDAMAAKLKKDGLEVVVNKALTEDHDVVWEKGTQVAELITETLKQLSATTA